MAKDTEISWATSTQNSHWGCTKKIELIDGKSTVSPGCTHCYAETFSKRVGLKIWGQDADRRFFKEKHHRAPYEWNHEAKEKGIPWRVFWNSMSDTFEDRRDLDDMRTLVFKTIRETPFLTHMLLTKRPENMVRLAPEWLWELPNVWAGTTAENQAFFDIRVEHLLKVPARGVRFLSCEPLVGPINLGVVRQWDPMRDTGHYAAEMPPSHVITKRASLLHWVLVGGMSGAPRTEMDLEWLASIVKQCQMAEISVHVKQDSHRFTGRQGRIPDELWALKGFPA